MKAQPSLFELPPDTAEVTVPCGPVATELQRLSAAAERVLTRLEQGPATNVQLSVPEIGGLAAIRRVWDLQQRGHIIEKKHVRGGIWRYTLRRKNG